MPVKDKTKINSIAKSLSETLSIELIVGLENPNNRAVIFLSMGKDVPAKAPAPNGLSFSRFIQSLIRLRFRPIIST